MCKINCSGWTNFLTVPAYRAGAEIDVRIDFPLVPRILPVKAFHLDASIWANLFAKGAADAVVKFQRYPESESFGSIRLLFRSITNFSEVVQNVSGIATDFYSTYVVAFELLSLILVGGISTLPNFL